jgi:hypothetical protein
MLAAILLSAATLGLHAPAALPIGCASRAVVHAIRVPPLLLAAEAPLSETPTRGLDLGSSTDASSFTMASANKGDLATLASLPLIWASLVITARVLCGDGGDGALTPTTCVFATQLLTVPMFAGSLLLKSSGWGKVQEEGGVDEVADAASPADDALVLQAGVLLGALWTLGGWLQTAGFSAGASASHGAFLTQMTTLIVPLAQVFRGDKLAPQILIACFLALPGIACFAFDAGSADSSSTLIGDSICALAAVAYSTYDIALAGVGDRVPEDKLNVVRALVGTVGAAATAILMGESLESLTSTLTAVDAPLVEASSRFMTTLNADGLAPAVVAGLSVPAVGIGCLATANAVSATIQPRAHAAVPPAFSQVFYAQTPLWASVFAASALHEHFSSTSLLGVAAFTASLAVAACPDDLLHNLGGLNSRGSPQRRALAQVKLALRRQPKLRLQPQGPMMLVDDATVADGAKAEPPGP